MYSSDQQNNPREDARALAREWSERVIANREQAERVREDSDGGDHYRPFAAAFRADPYRSGDAALDSLLAIAAPDDIWLDVGAGAGRFSLPLALQVDRLIAIEPSPSMRAELAALQVEQGIFNIDIQDQRWPSEDPSLTDIADVALISHVGYDIEPIAAFLDTLERAARRACVALMYDRSPGSLFWQVWPAVHAETQAHLPGATELIRLLAARGTEPQVSEIGRGADRQRFHFESLDGAMDWARRRLWLAQDSARLPLLRDALDGLLIEAEDGWSLPDQPTQMLIRWRTT